MTHNRPLLSDYEGCIDSWSPSVKGWVINRDSPNEPVEITLVVDAKIVARVFASDPRPDVQEAGLPTNFCGFSIPVHEVISDSSPHDVSIVLSRTGAELFAPESRISFNSLSPILTPEQRGIASIHSVSGDVDSLQKACKGNRIAIVSGYRPPGVLERSTTDIVDALFEAGFVVVVIDTSERPIHDRYSAALVVHRANFGHDFASWNTARELIGSSLNQSTEILLVNDSCYGPFSRLNEILGRMRDRDLDVVSLTDGWFGSHHLQSNFLLFNETAVRSRTLDDFFEQYDFPILKSSIVGKGEIGLSRFLRAKELRIGAVFDYAALGRSFLDGFEQRIGELSCAEDQNASLIHWLTSVRTSLEVGEPLNATHVFWEELLFSGMPFVKRDLLIKNKLKVPNLHTLGSVLQRVFGYEDCDWIRADLQHRGSVALLF